MKIQVTILAMVMALTACNQADNPPKSENKQTAKTAVSTAPSEPKPAKDEPAQVQNVANDAPKSAEHGKMIYEKACKLCHNQGLLDAPKIGDQKEWQVRTQKGLTVLYHHASHGFNRMPPQAVGAISESDVQAAVDYLLANSQ